MADGIVGSRVTVSNSAATPIVTAVGFDRWATVTNLDATNAIDLGKSDVASAAGFQVKSGVTTPLLIVPSNTVLYGIATAAPVSVAVLIMGPA